MCGFTVETIQFLSQYGYPFEVVNVLHDMDKRAVLTEMTNWLSAVARLRRLR
jgi:glutaredoxin-related protein